MAQIIHAKDLRSGHTFIYKNNLYLVIENSFNKTAMREGIVKCKVKNLRTGSITEETLTGEKLEQAPIDKVKAVFSYATQNEFVFMDNQTFESIEVPINRLNKEKNFIVESIEVNITKYGDEILEVILPDQVTLKVEFAEEAASNSGATSRLKKARLETGFEVEVQEFIKTGDSVIIDTKTGKYIGRGK
ncbi:MAG: elongation factor P [Malacoplasma sp.]|nr:elongation factor P [Malacoplasma sp.]